MIPVNNGKNAYNSFDSKVELSMERQMLNKVPEITIFFWIIKVLCTTVGETFSDFLNITIGLGLTFTTILMGFTFIIIMFFQLRATKYVPGIYWLAVVIISVLGTLITDNMTDGVGVPLQQSTIIFSVLLMLTFLFWYLSEKTLSVHSIFTLRREAFYWLAILFTFALGTAVGDLYSEQLGLGYLNTGIIVAVIIACVFLAWKFLKIDGVLAFWTAYIFTRPLGASLGDFLSQPKEYGGLGLGATVTSVIFLIAILGIIIFLSITKLDTTPKSDALSSVQTNVKKKNVLAQTIAVIGVFLTLGISSYVWCSSNTAPQAAPTAASQTTLSGQLTKFISIENDMLNSLNLNDFSTAQKRADNLEHDWDASAAQLRKIDKAKWSEIDGTFDDVLAAVRSKNPDASKSKTVITYSLSVLNNANK